MVEPSERFEELKIPLSEHVHGLEETSGVLGVPRWWPPGSRVSVVLCHGATEDMDDPVLVGLQEGLARSRYLTLRFNFPFAEARKTRADSMPVLRRALRAAVALLMRDPTAAPAHLILGGKGLGARVAADLSTSRLRTDGLFLMGYPLHPQDRPEKLDPDQLFRIVSPLLFLQGDRDRTCDLETLRGILWRVGAPTTLHVSEGSDRHFRVTKRSQRTNEEVIQELVRGVDDWIQEILGGTV